MMIIKPAFALDLGEAIGIKNKFPTLNSFISNLLLNAYAFLGVVFLFLLIFGGWGIIMGAGGGDSGKVEEGKKAVSAAVVGFAVIFLSYFIVRAIEVVTGVKILNPPF